MEQDDGVIVAVYELPASTHVAFIIRSKVSQALASQIIDSAEDILDDMHITDEQRLQCRQVCLKYAPYTDASNPQGYYVPSLTQEVTVKSVIVNCAYSDCNLHQNLLDELINKFHRFSTANVIDALAGYLGNLVLTEKDVLEHRLFAIEKQRRHIVKTLRCDEVPSEFWERAGIQQIAGLPLFIATSRTSDRAGPGRGPSLLQLGPCDTGRAGPSFRAWPVKHGPGQAGPPAWPRPAGPGQGRGLRPAFLVSEDPNFTVTVRSSPLPLYSACVVYSDEYFYSLSVL